MAETIVSVGLPPTTVSDNGGVSFIQPTPSNKANTPGPAAAKASFRFIQFV